MRNELTIPTREELHGRRNVPIDAAVELGMDLVDPQFGPIIGFTERSPEVEVVREIFQYVSYIQDTTVFSPHGLAEPNNTGGLAIDRNKARIAAIGEAIERYCLSLSDPEDFLSTNYANLDSKALDPVDMSAFSHRQLQKWDLTPESIRSADYHWTKTREMVTGEATLIPGQLVYVPFSSPTTIRSPTTIGTAAGVDYESACYRSLCELIERECFMIGYMNKISFPKIDLLSINDDKITTLKRELEHRGTDIHVFDISLDHPFYTCLTIAVSEDQGPKVHLGLDTDIDMTIAIRGALSEALQMSIGNNSVNRLDDEQEKIRTLDQRAAFWARPSRINDLDFWIDTEAKVGIQETVCARSEALDVIEAYLQDMGYRWYVADITTPDIYERGFRVISSVVPSFHPMHLVESFRYLGSDRLYSVPVEAGYRERKHREEELNLTPHPFL